MPVLQITTLVALAWAELNDNLDSRLCALLSGIKMLSDGERKVNQGVGRKGLCRDLFLNSNKKTVVIPAKAARLTL